MRDGTGGRDIEGSTRGPRGPKKWYQNFTQKLGIPDPPPYLGKFTKKKDFFWDLSQHIIVLSSYRADAVTFCIFTCVCVCSAKQCDGRQK